MTPAEIMQLEALRTVALAAVTSAQGVLQTIESMILTDDREASQPDAPGWDAFDNDPPSTGVSENGTPEKRKVRRRRPGR
jgi:hypothetical protein